MVKNVNENLVKISSSPFIVEQGLLMDQEVVLRVKGDVVKVEEKSNQDGTVDRIAVVKVQFGEDVEVVE